MTFSWVIALIAVVTAWTMRPTICLSFGLYFLQFFAHRGYKNGHLSRRYSRNVAGRGCHEWWVWLGVTECCTGSVLVHVAGVVAYGIGKNVKVLVVNSWVASVEGGNAVFEETAGTNAFDQCFDFIECVER